MITWLASAVNSTAPLSSSPRNARIGEHARAAEQLPRRGRREGARHAHVDHGDGAGEHHQRQDVADIRRHVGPGRLADRVAERGAFQRDEDRGRAVEHQRIS